MLYNVHFENINFFLNLFKLNFGLNTWIKLIFRLNLLTNSKEDGTTGAKKKVISQASLIGLEIKNPVSEFTSFFRDPNYLDFLMGHGVYT